MPFTLFHLGPGMLVKGVALRGFSWSAFVASNAIIDLESAYYLVSGAEQVHRTLHTFLGAAVVGVATTLVLLAARRYLRAARTWFDQRSATLRAEATPTGMAAGAMLGALSHPLLDGIMHSDIQPLRPFSTANPLRGWITIPELHTACMIAGVIGVVLVVVRRR